MRGGELDRHLCSCCLSPWPLVSLPSTRWAPLINLISSDASLCQSVSPPLVFSLARHDRRLKLCGSPHRPSPGLQPKDGSHAFHSSQRSRSPCPLLPTHTRQAWAPPPLPAGPSSMPPALLPIRPFPSPGHHTEAPPALPPGRSIPKPKSLQPAPRSTFPGC